MFLLISIMLFLGGLIPFIIVKRYAKPDNSVLVIGGLAWACGMSLKAFISVLLTVYVPSLFYNPSILIAYAIIIESAEVLAAYIFLKYLPSFKKVSLRDLLGFGAGFGIGEAWTIAFLLALPISFPFTGFVSTMPMFERFSAILIHITSVVFIGLFIKNKKKLDAVFGLLSKNLTVTLLVLPGALQIAGLVGDSIVYFTELFIGLYAITWLMILLKRLGKFKLGKARAKIVLNKKKVALILITVFLFYIPFRLIVAYLFFDQVTSVFALTLSLFFISLVFLKKGFSKLDVLLGVFLGACLSTFFRNFLGALENPSLYALIGVNVLSAPLLALFGTIMAGVAVTRFKNRKFLLKK